MHRPLKSAATPIPTTRAWVAILVVQLLLLLSACRAEPEATGPGIPGTGDPVEFIRLEGITTANQYGGALDEDLARWQQELPDIQDVRIPSSADDHEQPALWLPPEGEGARPLLVVLHTWSTEYLQNIGIPFGHWARDMGWAMIHPNFRGANDNPDATGSDLAVQDVIDAVDFAADEASIDESRVYLIGFSGGGYKSLLMAGRHPDRFAAAAAWVPIHNLTDWYEHHVATSPGAAYIEQISQSCGGDPTAVEAAAESCRERSPSAHLDAARDAGIPIYIGHGLSDDIVPPSHAARAFNQLADEGDRLDDSQIQALTEYRLPDDLSGETQATTYFADQDPEVLFARESASAMLVLFEGEHDMVYHPGLEWMIRQTE